LSLRRLLTLLLLSLMNRLLLLWLLLRLQLLLRMRLLLALASDCLCLYPHWQPRHFSHNTLL
jgi:hypothetical protein